MANYAYLSLWCRKFTSQKMLELFERLLALFPASEARPGFYALTVRGLSLHEPALLEQDDVTPLSAAEAIAAAQEYLHEDCSYETQGYWDHWRYQLQSGKLTWLSQPVRVEFICYAPLFEEGIAADSGHFNLKLGFEHLYTGHAGLLLGEQREPDPTADELEREFLRVVSNPQVREEYREKTRANIHKLLAYVEALEKALPLERRLLCSEGEEDFEAFVRRIQSG